jgi:hypothetical protein
MMKPVLKPGIEVSDSVWNGVRLPAKDRVWMTVVIPVRDQIEVQIRDRVQPPDGDLIWEHLDGMVYKPLDGRPSNGL